MREKGRKALLEIETMSRDTKLPPPPAMNDEEDEEDQLPFEGIDKAAVLQQCRDFSAVNINVPNCIERMLKVLYLISAGVNFTPIEATDIFFGATKLFQNDNPKLRRILFVFLKELSGIAEQVFIASSSLVKDISSNNEVNRCNAIRTLRKVTDSTMIGPMERYLKQAVVDKNNSIVSAAIVTGIHLAHTQPEMVKRWGTEVSEALKNRGSKVQYHALALLHKLRKNDRLSVLKLVQQAQGGPIRSPLALCLLIKMCTELLQEDFGQSLELYKFVTNMTHHSSDLVVFEAAKAICSLKGVTVKEISPAVLVIGLYLTSHRPTCRFAAIRLLNKVSTNYPQAVAALNADIEGLVSDPNRSIATLAITTLLKTGTEFGIDRLVRQLTGSLADLSDEFRVVIIESMKVLNAKFPTKHPLLLEFLFSALREEGGGEFKHAIVETMISIANTNPAAKETVLLHLIEFIEDCEYVFLIKRVLVLIGEEGPSTAQPKKFIRYVYNHVMLESPVVRGAAITTLAKFAAQVPALRPSIAQLFKRITSDPDDEVRDRAVFYHKLFTIGDEVAIRTLVSDVAAIVKKTRNVVPAKVSAFHGEITATPTIAAAADGSSASSAGAAGGSSAALAGGDLTAVVLQLRERLRKIPQLKDLGEPNRSIEPLLLTEPDNEYVVSVAKHLYAEHIVLQFKVQNTMDNISLHKISVTTDTSELEVEPLFAFPISHIDAGATEYGYVVLAYNAGRFPAGTVRCTFTFSMKDADDDEPQAPEEYPIEELVINVCDFITPLTLSAAAFESQWTALQDKTTTNTYALPVKNLTAAAQQLVDFFGMYVDGGRPERITTKSHVVNMSGVISDAVKTAVLVSGKVFITADNTIALQLSLRGGTEEIREYLCEALMS